MEIFFVSYGVYILLGSIAGTLSGLLGVGGGVIVVPGFVWLFQMEAINPNIIMHMAAGTSLAAMIITASFSLYAHYRRGAVFGSILYYMIPGLIIGTALGAIIAQLTHSYVLKILLGLLLIIISFKEFFTPRPVKTSELQQQKVSNIVIAMAALLIGILSGMFGIGGGSLMIPFLDYCGINIRQAVGISVAGGLIVAVTGTLSFILTGINQANLPPDSLGYIYLPACIGVAIGSPVFAFLGTMLHQRLAVGLLRKIFSVFLIFVGIRLVT